MTHNKKHELENKEEKNKNTDFYARFLTLKKQLKEKDFAKAQVTADNIETQIPDFYKINYIKGIIEYNNNNLEQAEKEWQIGWDKEWKK